MSLIYGLERLAVRAGSIECRLSAIHDNDPREVTAEFLELVRDFRMVCFELRDIHVSQLDERRDEISQN